MTADNTLRGKVVVAGVGYSELGKDTGRSEASLTVESVTAALQDAGMTAADVDGLTPWPARQGADTFSGPPLSLIQRSFGMNLRYWHSGGDGAAQLSGLIDGALAIACGLASVVVTWRTVIAQPRAKKVAARPVNVEAWHESGFLAPYGVAAMAPKWALLGGRFLYETGQDSEALASVVLNNRAHAQLNPRAAWYGKPLDRDGYFASPVISTPLRIVDCDMPIDASVAIVLASADRAGDLAHRPALIEAVTGTPGTTPEPELAAPELTQDTSYYNGKALWGMTDLRPTDVDVAELYDGFSFQTLMWTEGLGFCGRGESGAMFAEGRTRVGGQLPVCTDGGQLGVGRYHGLEKVAQASRQLWGSAGQAQVEGAEVAVAAVGSGSRGGAILLTKG
jgi:acetyl-CoA acetyltransferase